MARFQGSQPPTMDATRPLPASLTPTWSFRAPAGRFSSCLRAAWRRMADMAGCSEGKGVQGSAACRRAGYEVPNGLP